jgi:hypothetical protein
VKLELLDLARLTRQWPPDAWSGNKQHLVITMTDEQITERLFVCEAPASAELAMVFAAATEEDLRRRTRRGVELYREGSVPRLLLTGGGVLARKSPEAKQMAEIARGLGVPESDLLVESRSSNTFENVRFSRALLEAQGLLGRLTTVLLVSSEWHMRRVLLTTKAYFPSQLRLLCCPTTEGCNRENWTTSPAYRNDVLQELCLLEALEEAGAI